MFFLEIFRHFAGDIIKCVDDLLSDVLKDFVATEQHVADLRELLDRMEAVLADASEQDTQLSIHLWLTKLKNSSVIAEDLLEEFDTERKRKAAATLPKIIPSMRRMQKVLDTVKELQRTCNGPLERLEKFYRVRRQHGDEKVFLPRRSSMTADSENVLGMEDQKDEILQVIWKQEQDVTGVPGSEAGCSHSTATASRRPAPVIAITGPGGIGKTTLAMLVYNDPRLKDYLKIRIDVTRQHDANKIIKEILEYTNESGCQDLSLYVLQRQLQKLIDRKKFLLVLDDAWNEDSSFWATLAPLVTCGGAGSVIIVTTQNEYLLHNVRTLATIRLTGLEEEESWTLFRRHAFGQQDFGGTSNLEAMGKQLVNRCQGSPLAIISLGDLLHDKSEEEWRDLLEYTSNLPYEEKGILSTLNPTYYYMPYHLKRCFAFCSLFPSGFHFDKDELVKLWIAVGLIRYEDHNNNLRRDCLESIGHLCFDNLRHRSLFLARRVGGGGNTDDEELKYIMPGLVHELSESVCDHQYMRVENNRMPPAECNNAVYASMYNCNLDMRVLSRLYQNERLRTLLLIRSEGGHEIGLQVVDRIFKKLKFLRALDLRNQNLRQVPCSIGNLIHLRYLNLHGNSITALPDSVTNLFNLQVLELGHCKNLQKLPQDLCQLINLRHLGLGIDWQVYCDSSNQQDNLVAMPPGISRLTSLQTLSRFVVSSEEVGTSSSIKEIEHLHLRGELSILRLEKMVHASHVEVINLESQRLLKLMLHWTTNPMSDGQEEMEMMERLQPPRGLKVLYIVNYPGNIFPSWLQDQCFCIQTIKLSNCRRCNSILPLGKLPMLKTLSIQGLDDVEYLGFVDGHFPALEVLSVSEMNNLHLWFDFDGEQQMTHLKELSIRCCPKLCAISHIPNSIQTLELINCQCLSVIPEASHSLMNFRVEKCPNL